MQPLSLRNDSLLVFLLLCRHLREDVPHPQQPLLLAQFQLLVCERGQPERGSRKRDVDAG
jgi:hypothetical protein